ncbi:MAG: multidrug transporter [Massilia sp.]|nr:multidrug transporter [Massilia sp.]
MFRYKYALTALLALFAGGCALQPVYHRPQAPVAATFPTGPAYGGAGDTGGPAAAAIGWRDFLAEPRLQRLVELALQNNRDLRIAALNVESVRAQYRIERAALYPQLNAGASGAVSRGAGVTTKLYSANLDASWELDFFGRLRSLSAAALEQYFASAEARQAAQILLVSQVADQYLAVLAFDDELAVTQNTLTAAQGSYDIVKLQYDNGVASELSLRQARVTVDSATANRAAQLRLRAQADNALVLLVGQPLPEDLPAPGRLASQPILADIPAGLPSDLLTRRPDILQAEALLRSENANIGAARAAFFPNITLTGSLGTASPTLAGLFGAGSGAWSFIPSLLAPIFDAGANQANLDRAVAQKDIGIAQYEKSIQTAFQEVSDGLAARGTYTEQLAALQNTVDDQQRRLDLSSLRYTSGADSYLNVLTAQTDLYNAQLSMVSARLGQLTSLVDLYRALGGGWLEHSGGAPRPAQPGQAAGQRPGTA